jgi:DNA-binding CsgD family transcriptional regulator/tetratricopeptide (TPR) repeat protein
LNDLPPETQQVLQAVAVDGGVNIAHGLLAKVTGLDDRQLSNALRPAITAHVLMVDEDRYAFRHGLIRSVVHRQLLVGERARLHRTFAQTLEIVPSLASHPLPSVQIAMHWRAAGEYERALPVAWQAANAARSTFAYATQLQMLEETLQLWHEVPDASRETGVDRITVIDRALDAAQLAGEPQRGLILLEDAWSDREGDDPERSAQLLRSRAALRQQLLLPGQVDDLRAALRLADGPTRTRAQILGLLIRALRVLDHDDEADALALEMLELATRLDDDELVLEASIRSAAVDARASDDGVTEMQRLIENAQRLGSGDLEVLARVLMTYALEGRGDHEAAVAAGRDGLARAQQLGLSRYVTAPIAQNLVESLTSTGAWDDALEVADETLRLDPAPYGRAFLLVSRCQIDLARGDLETAQRELNELVSLLPTDEASTELALPVVCLRMELLLAEGDLEPALATARAFAEEPSGTDPRYLWPALTTAMRVCADAAGRPRLSRDATTVRHTITELTKQLAQPSRLARAHAAVMVAEAARADRRPSPAAWQAAAHDWQAVGQPYALGYALLRGSEAAAMEGDREAAGERVVQSATIASRLRARRLLDQAVQHARRARLQLPPDLVPPGTASADAPLGLTSRETDVLRLVAAGHSNKRIGAELFISPKTASVHVSRILTKLGVATRTEAAAAAHRLGLVDAD